MYMFSKITIHILRQCGERFDRIFSYPYIELLNKQLARNEQRNIVLLERITNM